MSYVSWLYYIGQNKWGWVWQNMDYSHQLGCCYIILEKSDHIYFVSCLSYLNCPIYCWVDHTVTVIDIPIYEAQIVLPILGGMRLLHDWHFIDLVIQNIFVILNYVLLYHVLYNKINKCVRMGGKTIIKIYTTDYWLW